MTVDLVDYEVLDTLTDELDLVAQKRETSNQVNRQKECQRRYQRSPFRVACKAYFFSPGTYMVLELSGRTRNLSRNGIGILVRRVFRIGEAMELELHVPDRPAMYMAGVVAFCRYAGRGYHEVGVELQVAGKEPIFSGNPATALQTMPWLNQDSML